MYPYRNVTRVRTRHLVKDCPDNGDDIRCVIRTSYWGNTVCRNCGEEMHIARSGVDTCSDRCRQRLSRKNRARLGQA